MLTAYEQFETRLIKSHAPVPDDVDDAVFSLIAALEVPVNHLTDRLDGELPDHHSGTRDRTAARYAAERRADKTRQAMHCRIASGAATGALQQRYMQHVRRIVHRRILAGLQSYHGPALVYDSRRVVNTTESEAGAAASVDVLTAAFIQNLFPLWGATTTPDVVRKSRPRDRTQRR